MEDSNWMPASFYEHPILNSPYEYPIRHWELDDSGIPTDRIVGGRRESRYITPVPPARRQSAQQAMILGVPEVSSEQQEYDPTPIINEIRRRVDAWRSIPDSSQWGVTPETERLLQHWRNYEFQGVRPFFCQIEAAETVIWLTEVAGILRNNPSRQEFRGLHGHIARANEQSNPELLRLALKMATGAGKTTVMAMLIAWQTINAVRYPQRQNFTRGFLITTHGITRRDRLRSLYPNDPDNYYEYRNLVPPDMLPDLQQARVVITNFHAFRPRERENISANTRRFLQGPDSEPINTLESDWQMLRRVMPELMNLKNILAINDEAHHCYRERPPKEWEERKIETDEKADAEKNAAAARVWISGLEVVRRNIGIRSVLDLSATPFFLRGSGYAEGTLFPWTVSDFSLMDAIESGIVKIPRVPVADNLVSGESPVYRNLWEHIRGRLPRSGRGQRANNLDPRNLPTELVSALESIYGHYEKTFDLWYEADVGVPPVFIIVCNNTATSKLVYDFVSGFERKDEDGNLHTEFLGQLELFSNYNGDGTRRALPRTLLIDSQQLESGDALSKDFRTAAAPAIERFRWERNQRDNARSGDKISDEDLLREVMNTVGKPGQLGEEIRCVVSVSMLTEGWDANTVTHILGVRAFGTQLLCEQVVGRALRRQSYDLNEEERFDVEYADILGIPFDFTAAPAVAPPSPPKRTIRVHSVSPERDHLEITFPRVSGYRVELPAERIAADFDEDSVLELTPEDVGPSMTSNYGIIGEGVELTLSHLENTRRQKIVFELSKHLLETHLREPGGSPKMHLFQQVRNIAGVWFDNYLRCYGGTYPAQLLYREVADVAAQRIKRAIDNASRRMHPDSTEIIKAVVDPYTPTGSTRFVNFSTSKTRRWQTGDNLCHINWAICDSDWELEFCRFVERHPRVVSYVKNQGMGFEVPYRKGSLARTYVPDFIVQIDDGRGPDDLLNIVLEVKGYRYDDVRDKSSTMHSYWIPGVNNLKTYGRWRFHEFSPEVYQMQDEFDALVSRLTGTPLMSENADYSSLNFKDLLAACPIDDLDLTRSDEPPREVELDVSD